MLLPHLTGIAMAANEAAEMVKPVLDPTEYNKINK
jgi:hypothetical protein